jgi:hypothetical protein
LNALFQPSSFTIQNSLPLFFHQRLTYLFAMPWLVSAFSLLVAAAGWYYMTHPHPALRLATIEQTRVNALRIRLRRICGAVTLFVGIGFFAGFRAVDVENNPHGFVAIWLCELALLVVMVTLAMVDVRLTLRLRRMIDSNLAENSKRKEPDTDDPS